MERLGFLDPEKVLKALIRAMKANYPIYPARCRHCYAPLVDESEPTLTRVCRCGVENQSDTQLKHVANPLIIYNPMLEGDKVLFRGYSTRNMPSIEPLAQACHNCGA